MSITRNRNNGSKEKEKTRVASSLKKIEKEKEKERSKNQSKQYPRLTHTCKSQMSMCTKTRWLLGGTPSRKTSAKLRVQTRKKEG